MPLYVSRSKKHCIERGMKMKTTIYCKPTAKGVHSFYLLMGSDEFYLFSQSYRKGVEEYYGRGVRIDDAIKHSRAHRDSAIIRTMDKIPMYVKYIEREFDISVLNSTKKHEIYSRTRCA